MTTPAARAHAHDDPAEALALTVFLGCVGGAAAFALAVAVLVFMQGK